MVVYHEYCISRANLLTSVSETASACLGNHKTVYRTFVASVMENTDYIFFCLRIDSVFRSFLYDMSFFIYTAACSRLRSWNKLFRNFVKRAVQSTVYKAFCYFPVDKIFNVLNIAFKFSHFCNRPYCQNLYICYLYVLTHFLKQMGKLINLVYLIGKVHFECQILMCRIYCHSLIYFYTVAVLNKQLCKH